MSLRCPPPSHHNPTPPWKEQATKQQPQLPKARKSKFNECPIRATSKTPRPVPRWRKGVQDNHRSQAPPAKACSRKSPFSFNIQDTPSHTPLIMTMYATPGACSRNASSVSTSKPPHPTPLGKRQLLNNHQGCHNPQRHIQECPFSIDEPPQPSPTLACPLIRPCPLAISSRISIQDNMAFRDPLLIVAT